jgi:hypothetical protein
VPPPPRGLRSAWRHRVLRARVLATRVEGRLAKVFHSVSTFLGPNVSEQQQIQNDITPPLPAKLHNYPPEQHSQKGTLRN